MRHLADLAYRISPTTRFTRYRGDGWQIYIENPGLGLSAVLFIWASLIAAENLPSRMAVGLGSAPDKLGTNNTESRGRPGIPPVSRKPLTHIGFRDEERPKFYERELEGLSGMLGEAFIASGRALDMMKLSQRIALSGEGVDALHKRLFSMIDERITEWSFEQAEAMALAFAPEGHTTQIAMAQHLNVSRQAVAARLQSGGYFQLSSAAKDFQQTFGRRDNHA